MRALLVGAVITTLGACTCVGPGEDNDDAGERDASVVRDAGRPDAAVGDAGGAGGADASVADAGGEDSGIADAGTLDAGQPDAATPSIETCDGVDNDFDGRIDRLADGGALFTNCPLAVGVCATARAYCVDGGWASCEYGALYEKTERTCDGLDNDCDGRIDRSRSVPFFTANNYSTPILYQDGGIFVPAGAVLPYAELASPQIIALDGGIWISLTDRLLTLDDDLALIDHQTLLPNHNGAAHMFLHDGEWWRIVRNKFVSEGRFGFTVQPLSWPNWYLPYDLVGTIYTNVLLEDSAPPTNYMEIANDGVVVLHQLPPSNRYTRAKMFFDGGQSLTELDAGFPQQGSSSYPGGALFFDFDGTTSRATRCDSQFENCTQVGAYPGQCPRLAQLDPMLLECSGSSGTLLFLDGGVFANEAKALFQWPVPEHAAVILPNALDLSMTPVSFGMISDAGIEVFGTLEPPIAGSYVALQKVRGKLHLLVWPEDDPSNTNAVLFFRLARSFRAEYVCAP